MKKLKETPSLLLNRNEVVYELDHFGKSTPKKDDIKKQLAGNLKVNEDLIRISKVINYFGSTKIKIIADIYKKKEDLQVLIRKRKKKAEIQPVQQQQTAEKK
ncbi:hypothetical protein HYT56_00265 [Candidatus Woesearchaeota archaeon]|nr:hypothetical protein [Candidatus Woesearchaeota archaeon]